MNKGKKWLAFGGSHIPAEEMELNNQLWQQVADAVVMACPPCPLSPGDCVASPRADTRAGCEKAGLKEKPGPRAAGAVYKVLGAKCVACSGN